MGWEVMREEKKPCPCGEGFYVIEYRSDDWGRSDERGHMECKKCRTDHAVVTSNGINRKGMNVQNTNVVKKVEK